LRVTLELGSNEAIKKAVQRGVGVAVLSVYAVHKELEAGHLIALPLKDIHCDRQMYVVQNRRSVLTFPARQFLTYLATNPLPALAS
jgi:DNA-binding transcriptional LysR family regulator